MRVRLFVLICFVVTLFASQNLNWIKAQEAAPAVPKSKTPADIEFTRQMSRAKKDLEWSETYFQSYQMTNEVSYLKLSAQFCMKSIRRLADTQNQLSRTTKFYNLVDQKRLHACQYYDMLQKKSFLLQSRHFLNDSGSSCR